MKCFLCAFAVVAAAVCQGQSLRSSIETYGQETSRAMTKKDFVTMEKLIRAEAAPGFQYIEGGKPQTIDQMIANMKAGLSMFKKVTSASSRVVSIKETGNSATAMVEYAVGGTLTGQDKKTHTMMSSGTSKDTYVKIGGKWKLKTMVWGEDKMTMDGKPMHSGG